MSLLHLHTHSIHHSTEQTGNNYFSDSSAAPPSRPITPSPLTHPLHTSLSKYSYSHSSSVSPTKVSSHSRTAKYSMLTHNTGYQIFVHPRHSTPPLCEDTESAIIPAPHILSHNTLTHSQKSITRLQTMQSSVPACFSHRLRTKSPHLTQTNF